jgi:hypothetical protein
MSRHAVSRAVRRAPLLVIVAGALVAGGVADRAGAPRVDRAVTAEAVQAVPIAAPAGAYSSSWFCAGATDAAPNYATGRIVVANVGRDTVTGTVTVVGSQGNPASTTISVGPDSLTTVAESVSGGSPWTGAIVDVEGGLVAVSQVLDGPLGRSSSPCATSGSQHWYFPTGQARVNASETILLLNPYPTDSIVDLSFSTDQGIESPQDFQSLDVPPGGLMAVSLGTHLRRRASIATTVSARTGNVVAWQVGIVTPPASGTPLVGTPAASTPLADPALPVPGIMVTLGAPSAGTSWVWPDGLAGAGLDEQYVVYNPGPGTAQVRLSVDLPVGTAEPIPLTLGPYQVAQIVSEQQARIPAGVAHTATLVSTNGVPVVAARTVTASNPAGVKGGAIRTGLGQMLGERVSARSWIVPLTAADASHQGQLVVENPGGERTTATVDGLPTAGQPTPAEAPVAAGGRSAIIVATGVNGPLLITAPVPIYVEYDLYGTGGTTGYDVSTAVPIG